MSIINKLKSVVNIILFDKEKKFLLQKRTKDAKVLPDYWAFFGGSVEKGETPMQAIKREALEELEFITNNPRLIQTNNITILGEKKNQYVYIEKCDDKSKLSLHEGQDWDWFNIDEIDNLKMINRDRRTLKFINEII